MSVMRFSTAICSAAIVPPDDEPAECDADGEFWRCRLPPPLPALPELPPLLLWLPAGLGTLMDISSGAAPPPPLPLLPFLPLLPPVDAIAIVIVGGTPPPVAAAAAAESVAAAAE